MSDQHLETPRCVLVVDDHPVVRRGLRALLEAEAWVGEVVEASTAAEAVRAAVTHPVRVVAMDLALPHRDEGIEATRRILQVRPGVHVLVFTMSEDEELVTRALRAGARGYVLKMTSPDTLIDSLRAVAGGGVVLGPQVGTTLLSSLRRAPAELPAPFDRLTTREREILRRLAAGDSNARIARHLGVTEKTVRNQLTLVFTKIGVADRVQAALLARDAGIAG